MNSDQLPPMTPLSPGFFDFLIVLGAIALVTLIVLAWLILFRKKSKRRHKHHSHTSDHERLETDSREGKIRVRKSYRHRRREHRPMNPTLAQTGGLPPVRSQQPPTPPQSEIP
jgi:FtsZ-interacting cell division protein ZipA